MVESNSRKQAATDDGLLTFGANLDLTKLTGWWPGGKLSFSVLEMHGSNLSRLALGDSTSQKPAIAKQCGKRPLAL